MFHVKHRGARPTWQDRAVNPRERAGHRGAPRTRTIARPASTQDLALNHLGYGAQGGRQGRPFLFSTQTRVAIRAARDTVYYI